MMPEKIAGFLRVSIDSLVCYRYIDSVELDSNLLILSFPLSLSHALLVYFLVKQNISAKG